jgi:hypothetical protein
MLLIPICISATSLLLYRKTKLKSLLLFTLFVWAAYFFRPAVILVFASLALLLREKAGSKPLNKDRC